MNWRGVIAIKLAACAAKHFMRIVEPMETEVIQTIVKNLEESDPKAMVDILRVMFMTHYGLVFCTHKKKGLITTGSVNSQFRQILRAAGIEPCGQHALRHTFATRCIEAGIPAVVLKTWLGHADIHMTLDIYTDVFNEMHHDAIRKLDAYLDEQE